MKKNYILIISFVLTGCNSHKQEDVTTTEDGHWWVVSRLFKQCRTTDGGNMSHSPKEMYEGARAAGGSAKLLPQENSVLVILDEGEKTFTYFRSKEACRADLIARGYDPDAFK